MSDEQGRRSNRPALGASYAAIRQRTDAWQRLKSYAARWHRLGEAAADALVAQLRADLAELARIESYWAYPGRRVVERMRTLLEAGEAEKLAQLVALVVRMLVSEAYRVYTEELSDDVDSEHVHAVYPDMVLDERPYFEILIVDAMSPKEEEWLRERLLGFRSDDDPFVYDIVVVPSAEDALIAVLVNHHIQSVVIRYGFPMESQHRLGIAERALARFDAGTTEEGEIGLALGGAIHKLRPNLDLFLVSDAPVEELAGRTGPIFRRVFFRQEDLRELHMSIQKGIRERYTTPFFSALRSYSLKPTGVFHALPIARGKSIANSHWIGEMEDFFGASLFLAETSATTGGLDSLLQPHGSLREAQAAAARAFGAQQTFFVTNGTSTANKIVLQAVARPGDIVLAARDCHMSHHYAFVLSGVEPLYLDPYPLRHFGFYGGVPLGSIKRELLALRAHGSLDRARVLLLTNCTFDGIVYNPLRVMEEVLAIQPEMTFIWDEAWFAFAAFTPITRRRTAMDAARTLRARFASADYRARYAAWKTDFDASTDAEKWQGRLMADPDAAAVRVYATQSTHKTLTSLRQGSMIHISDDWYSSDVAAAFQQAYLTHTSSSANYPILASLDIGRRQVELEGYELVQHAIELALTLRERINPDPALARYFQVLTPQDLIPAEYRPSGFSEYLRARTDWEGMDLAWEEDEFCLDPTRLTLHIARSAMTGDAFKTRLIDEHDIQVNKTSPNTALFMTHIGTTRGAVAHLIDVLSRCAQALDAEIASEGPHHAAMRRRTIEALTEELPPLPDFSSFHPAFCRDSSRAGREGDIRKAFFAATDEPQVTYRRLDDALERDIEAGQSVVAASFVTPYPPGFPVLVPGQVISAEIFAFLRAIDGSEIHGYDPKLGLRVFTVETLSSC